jgi:hypothetical protein
MRSLHPEDHSTDSDDDDERRTHRHDIRCTRRSVDVKPMNRREAFKLATAMGASLAWTPPLLS